MFMCLTSILILVSFLGFAYIVWILSNKESAPLKLMGQIIAVVIAVLAVVLLIYGAVYGPSMKTRWMDKGMMGPMMKYPMRQMMIEEHKKQMMEMMEKGKKAK